MKKRLSFGALGLSLALLLSSCGANNTVKGTGLGAAGGAALGTGIGAIFGGGKGAAWGAGIGAVLGGGAGAIIGNKMDKQKAELENINGAQVESINEGQAIKVTFASGILFPTNSSTLNSASQTALSQFAVSLKNNPDTNIEIDGFTDSTGSPAINDPLSQARAQAVYNYLLQSGVPANRMVAKGFGAANPVASNDTPAGRAQNRRVEVYITPNEKMIQEAQQGR